MSKRRCDPIHYESTLAALAEYGIGLIGPSRDTAVLRRLYADYASVAAIPYARVTWELLLRAEQRNVSRPQSGEQEGDPRFREGKLGGPDGNGSRVNDSYASERHRASDYWGRFEQVKPANVLTTTSDSASIKVKGSALIVSDAPLTLTYEKRGPKPQAIVMLGWSGYVSIPAMRFCTDYAIAIIVLDCD